MNKITITRGIEVGHFTFGLLQAFNGKDYLALNTIEFKAKAEKGKYIAIKSKKNKTIILDNNTEISAKAENSIIVGKKFINNFSVSNSERAVWELMKFFDNGKIKVEIR